MTVRQRQRGVRDPVFAPCDTLSAPTMEPFVDQLVDLCRRYPTRAKWVFVPTHALGRTIGDRLVISGTDWANLRFVTPFEIALRMGAPFLVERGIDPSEEGLGPALVMRLLLDLPEEGGYFRPLASQPTMATALWTAIQELRMAGLAAADLDRDAFEPADKHAELVALVTAYEQYLATNARGDRRTVFDEALRHLDWCPVQPTDCWTTLPDVVWSTLERRLFEVLPGERVTPRAIALPGLAAPRRLNHVLVERIAPRADNSLAFLTLPKGFTPGPAAGTLSLFHAGGAEAEIEEVFRRVLAADVSADEVEVVCASPAVPAVVWEKALRHEWPVTIGHGVGAVSTRPGRALLAFTDWIDDDFAAGALRRMLQSGDVRIGEDVGVASGRASRLLVQAEAAWGRDTYRLALGRLAASARRAADRDDRPDDERAGLVARADEADRLARWIDTLVRSVPASGADGLVDVQEVAAAARAFATDIAARANALDHVAATALADALAELQALGPFRCPMREALRFLRERVETATLAADRPRPGHLYVSALATAGLSGRRLVFVVGLEEGRVFPPALEDPVLLDHERERLTGSRGPELPLFRAPGSGAAGDATLGLSGDRTEEAVYVALVRLAALSSSSDARVTLSYSCRDLREYRQTFPSWLMLQAYRVISGRTDATFHDLHDHLGTPVSIVPAEPDEALDESRWWLHGAMRSGDGARPAILARYPSLASGVRAGEARLSDVFTEFDGDVPVAGPVLDPARPGIVVSPTALEEAAACPFRYFLKRGLGVGAIEAGERDRDVWLNPLLRGSLLHDLYARFMRRCRIEGRRASVEADAAWLANEGQRALRELAVEMPPPSAEVGEREARALLEDLALFVQAEAALPATRTPVGFEVGFGRADAGDVEPLARAEPVEIDLSGLTLRVAGRIDRIDQVGPSTFEIVDYKTGSYFAPAWEGTFAGGARLQHALYGLAATELLRRQFPQARVAAAEYYFPSEKGHQERKRIPTLPIAAVGEVLADLRAVIASGAFVHASDKEVCKFCHHGLACGRNAIARAGSKLTDPRLASFVRLTSHE